MTVKELMEELKGIPEDTILYSILYIDREHLCETYGSEQKKEEIE